MDAKTSDPALTVCRFIQAYGEIWDRFFPNSVRKAHWQICCIVRSKNDGIVFSSMRGRLDAVYGLDEETSILRINELVSEGLIQIDEPDIRSSTPLSPTPKLRDLFDAHVGETLRLLYSAAREIQPTFPSDFPSTLTESANRVFFDFFESFLSAWDEQRAQFLRDHLESPARRNKALLSLKTYAYWHIFMTAWVHAHPLTLKKCNYLLVDDFHNAIYQHVGVSAKATAGYVQDMIDWGFLRRLSRDDGVPRGKFAVQMERDTFNRFHAAFGSTADLVVEAGQSLMEMFSRDAGEVRPNGGNVVKFRAF